MTVSRLSPGLVGYLPKWIENCKESIRFLNSGEEYTAFCIKHHQEDTDTPESILERTEFYRNELARYEAQLAMEQQEKQS